MSKEQFLFEERQFLGLNKYSLVRRMILATACFVAYYWSENPKPVDLEIFEVGPYPGAKIERSGQIFFLLGIILLLFSTAMVFIVHMNTRISGEGISIKGLWGSRNIFIPFASVSKVKKVKIRETIFSKPVFNLHSRGKIRFYSRGNEAVEFETSDGTVYRIGTQKSQELIRVINQCLKK